VARSLRALLGRGNDLLARAEARTLSAGGKGTPAARMAAVVRLVGRKFAVPEWQIYSDNRRENVARARQICMALGWKEFKLSLRGVGKLFSRDHCTVTKAIRAVKDLYDTNAAFRQEYDALVAGISGKIQPPRAQRT